ncbi:MAG: LytR C-terminal domain-containing protein, partial [Deltaproteobacteria bacterium]|nr:LytR C-terminal domain-containing protein [Deltaproteobacteria bacterium]
APPPPPPDPPERPQLRDLFSDMLPETPPPPPPPQDSGTTQGPPGGAQAGPAGAASREGGGPAVSGALTPPPGAMGGEGGAFAPFPEASPAPVQLAPLLAPQLPPPLPPREVGPDREGNAAAFDRPAIQTPAPPENPHSGPAIGRAGSLLAEDGPTPPGGRSRAAILTPPAPLASLPQTGGRQGSSPAGGGAGGDAAAGQSRRRARRVPAPLPKPDLTVMIVNETGNPSAADNYGSVLASIGYSVVGVAERASSSPGSRQTVIAYRPGKEAQARALARRLPGDKAVSVSREPLPAEAVVIIR